MLTREKVGMTGKSKPNQSGVKISVVIGKDKSWLIRTFKSFKLKPKREPNKLRNRTTEYEVYDFMPSVTFMLQTIVPPPITVSPSYTTAAWPFVIALFSSSNSICNLFSFIW